MSEIGAGANASYAGKATQEDLMALDNVPCISAEELKLMVYGASAFLRRISGDAALQDVVNEDLHSLHDGTYPQRSGVVYTQTAYFAQCESCTSYATDNSPILHSY